MLFSLLHEESFIGIVDEVVEQSVGIHRLVRQWRALIYMRVHTYRSTIHDDIVFLDDLRGDFIVLDSTWTFVSTHKDSLQSERFQAVVDGFRRTASTENQCLLVERLDEWFDALGETDDITVVSLEDSLVAFMLHFYHVDRSDSICFGANLIKITDYLLLVRDGYIEAF